MAEDTITQVLFIRHAKTSSPRGVYPTEDLVRLSGNGIYSLRYTKKIVEEFRPEFVIVSPFVRCRETFQHISAVIDCPFEFDSRVRERVIPSLLGMTHKAIARSYGQNLLDNLLIGTERVELPGEETVGEACNRVADCVADCAQKGQRVLIVSHGGPHSWLCCNILDLGLEYLRLFTLDPAHASLFEFKPDASLKRIVYMNRH